MALDISRYKHEQQTWMFQLYQAIEDREYKFLEDLVREGLKKGYTIPKTTDALANEIIDLVCKKA